MKILIVQKSDLKIASKYDADAPNQPLYGGPWGDPGQTIHLACPAELDADCVKVVDVDGALEVQVDVDLAAEKLERQWSSLRQQRNQKLAACDWTQMADAPLNAQDKTAWGLYRQELRDLPENTEDPANPVWPDEPDVQI